LKARRAATDPLAEGSVSLLNSAFKLQSLNRN